MKEVLHLVVQFLFQNPSSFGTGTNWQAELFDSAPISNTTFSASGGSDTTTYFLSAVTSSRRCCSW